MIRVEYLLDYTSIHKFWIKYLISYASAYVSEKEDVLREYKKKKSEYLLDIKEREEEIDLGYEVLSKLRTSIKTDKSLSLSVKDYNFIVTVLKHNRDQLDGIKATLKNLEGRKEN